jgi:hypothetical protein
MNEDALLDLARCIDQGRAATIEAAKKAEPALLDDLRRVEALWEATARPVRAALSPPRRRRTDSLEAPKSSFTALKELRLWFEALGRSPILGYRQPPRA